MTTQVALAYSATAVGPISPAQLETAMSSASIPLPYNDVSYIGLTLVSDTMGLAGSVATRTIVYSVLPPFTTFAVQTAPGTFQGSIVSSSTNDTFPSGSGVTTMRINYTDEDGQPKYELIQMNGTTFVNLTSKTKTAITSFAPVGTPAGLITVMSGLNGTGVLINQDLNNFQGSIMSSNPNDNATGIGARTVTVTYHDKTGAGPFTETVTLNGTTPVSFTNVNHAVINNMVVASVGSYGSSTGTISMFSGVVVNDPSQGPPRVSGALVAYLGASYFQFYPPQMTINAGLENGGNLNSIVQSNGTFITVPSLPTINTVVASDQGSPLRGIYTHILGAALACPVTAAEPVFS